MGTFWYQFLAGTPFSLKKGALAPFLREKGGTGPLFDTASPPFAEKKVPAKLVISTKISTAHLNLILANTDTKKTAGNTVVYNSSTRVVYQISIFRSISVGISRYLPYRYQRKSWSVHFGIIFLAGTAFSLKKGALAPFLREKGGTGPLFDTGSPPFPEKGVPAKLVIPTKILTAQLNLILAKYRYQKNCW